MRLADRKPAGSGDGLRAPRTVLLFAGCLCVVAAVCEGRRAQALIDPSFTPVHLVGESGRIVAGKLRAGNQPDRWTMAEIQTLKGEKAEAVELSLALATAQETRDARELLRTCTGSEVMLFLGKFWGTEPGLLLVRNVWFTVQPDGANRWKIAGLAEQMSKTYDGSADKLIEMVNYILQDDGADVPVSVGIKWERCIPVGRVRGFIHGMAALDAGPGRAARLFVASTQGNRLFALANDGTTFDDLTASATLDTASRAFAFVDLNRDGRSDLASWNGTRLQVRYGRNDDGFERAESNEDLAWPDECTGLAAISPAQDGSPGLLLSGKWPQLLAWNERGWLPKPLPGDRARHHSAGPLGSCVVADWDEDGYVDVLQLGDEGSLLWRGKTGGFEEPTTCEVQRGGSPGRWCVGDFDADGRPDLFVSGREVCELWENAGGGRFRPVIQYAGSLRFKCLPAAADCVATDLNHDGRPDLAILYEKGNFFYHFNRGYRLMGELGELTLMNEQNGGRSANTPGPTRTAVGDFDGNGTLDLAVAFATGRVSCSLNSLATANRLWIALPKGRTGPVTVSVWQDSGMPVCVGTYLVKGHSPVYVSVRKPAPCTLKWRWPGEPPRELEAETGDVVVIPMKETGR